MSDFDKSNEVLFRLGIIYKQQTKYDESLRCFDRILRNPPSPLANADIWFQIGHVYEQQGDVRVSFIKTHAASNTHLARSCSGSLRACCCGESGTCKGFAAAWLAVSSGWAIISKSRSGYTISDEEFRSW